MDQAANSDDDSAYGDEDDLGQRSIKEKAPLFTLDQFMGEDGILRDDTQREREENYKQPERPTTIKTKQKWRKLEIRKLMAQNQLQVILFNFIADDYRQLLRKLLNLVPHFPTSLKFIIVHLPANATTVDLYYARKI